MNEKKDSLCSLIRKLTVLGNHRASPNLNTYLCILTYTSNFYIKQAERGGVSRIQSHLTLQHSKILFQKEKKNGGLWWYRQITDF